MKGKINGLDLFSGIGGISIALSPWVKTIAYCENDRYAQSVLLSRMYDGDIDMAPIWDDITTLRAKDLPVVPDIIFGGFPCQDISTAGHGVGLDGKRSGLFFEICRLIGDLRPAFVFLENVPAISVRGLDRVLLELTALGYDSRWTTVSAASVGACHKRDRWFLLAHSDSSAMRKQHEQKFNKQKNGAISISPSFKTPHSDGERFEGKSWQKSKNKKPSGYGEWISEPSLCGRNHGIQHRSHRLKCCGNSVVPEQAKKAFKELGGFYYE